MFFFDQSVFDPKFGDNKESEFANRVLPEQDIAGNSVELSLNSRVSYHDGYKGRISDQWLSNVLWAAGHAPTTGDHRNIFVTLPGGKYQYDPVRELPDAPLHIVLSLDSDDVDKWYARLEAGFVAGNMLFQGSAMGVGCWFTTDFSDDERKGVRDFAGMNMDDVPLVIVSTAYIDN